MGGAHRKETPMERIRERRASGLSRNMLRAWGMVFMALGVVGRGIFQNALLGLHGMNSQQILAILNSAPELMTFTTIALVMQILETCAVPIFAFLLVDGFTHTSNFKAYLIRVAGVALISELPYNLVVSGKLFDLSSRNPVFALALGLVMLFLMNMYPGKSAKNVLIKIIVAIAALIWAGMLRIDNGGCIVFIILALGIVRGKPSLRSLFGATAAISCSLVSPFYLASPMSFLAIHFYNGEKGEENRMVNYLAYPVILLVVGIISTFVL